MANYNNRPVYRGGTLPAQPDWRQFMVGGKNGHSFDPAAYARAMMQLQFGTQGAALQGNINQTQANLAAIPENYNKAFAGMDKSLADAATAQQNVMGATQAANTGAAASLGGFLSGDAAGQFAQSTARSNDQQGAMRSLIAKANSDAATGYQNQRASSQVASQNNTQAELTKLLMDKTTMKKDAAAAYAQNLLSAQNMQQQAQGQAISMAGQLQNQNLTQAMGADQLAMSGLSRTAQADQIAFNRQQQSWNDFAAADNHAAAQQALDAAVGSKKHQDFFSTVPINSQDALFATMGQHFLSAESDGGYHPKPGVTAPQLADYLVTRLRGHFKVDSRVRRAALAWARGLYDTSPTSTASGDPYGIAAGVDSMFG
jgi:hypothetical protein